MIAVVGSLRSEGVTSVAANLATSLARKINGPVLLADGNMRNPSVYRLFKKQLTPRLKDTLPAKLSDVASAVLSLGTENLHVLTPQKAKDQTLELVYSDQFAKLLNDVKQDYQYVIVDLPAILSSGASIRLAALCDKVILVAEAGRVRWEVLQKTAEHLQKAKADVLGIVLNKRRYPIPKWVYRSL